MHHINSSWLLILNASSIERTTRDDTAVDI